MIKIRPKQMTVMGTEMFRKFRSRLKEHARAEFPEATADMTDPTLDQWIDDALARGKKHGITSERDVNLFFDLFFLKGRNFDKDPATPWVQKILHDESLEGDYKMDVIYQRFAALENAGVGGGSR